VVAAPAHRSLITERLSWPWLGPRVDMFRTSLAILLALANAASAADLRQSARAHAVRRSGPIHVDGALDEAAWAAAPVHGDFVQRFPTDAARPSFDTRFAILYDDDAIYVAVWADDPDPDQIRALLTRRDVASAGDSLRIAFDSYHDRRTAYAFQLNAAGVQRDLLLFDDTNEDDSWDAVWSGSVAITPTGWTAEYRIPLSQLRFAASEAHEWGFQVSRQIGRTGEVDAWSPWPRSAPQVVSKFGVVDGIDGLQRQRRLELLPYATAGIDRAPVAAGDPINEANGWRRSAGLDLKYGLGSAFTLSASVNPDFGQVEADPSKINLSANELFFAEKRPLFLESVDLFKLPIGNSDGAEGAFYSRRIGATPPAPTGSYDFVERPQSTSIYGAAKLTGRTTSGWSVGVLDAVTGAESSEVTAGGQRSSVDIAALTNFAIARVRRDFNSGETALGASATAVNRALSGTSLAATTHDQAYTAGAQFEHRWDDNAWRATGSVLGSWVHGTPAAIAATQQSSVHYFQRPDATDVHLDDTRTSLAGLAARFTLGRTGDTEHWRYGTGGALSTPGLELNDAGYQQSSDRIVPYVFGEYRDDTPGRHLLNWSANSYLFPAFDFESRLLHYGVEYNWLAQLASYWSIGVGGTIDGERWSTTALRGGRALRVDPALTGYVNVQTDTRAPLWFSVAGNGAGNPTTGERELAGTVGAAIQALAGLDLYVGANAYWRDDPLQYVNQVDDDTSLRHFLFGRIHETDYAMTLRLNWTFSPRLALQVYAQPYLASGRYDELKDIDRPSATRYSDRFHVFTPDEAMLSGGTYRVMRNGTQFQFARPDFNFRELRSSLVLRWEYRPGSTVFAIWSHQRSSDALDDGQLRPGRDLGELARAASENVIIIKANYWCGV
jgi:uncharacterized protein DUF5916/cellulose/xylan binding protein with CBM9 domain